MRVDRATAMTALPVMFFFDALGVGLVLLGYTMTGLVVVLLGGLAFLGVCLYVERKRRASG
jgi:1,4-dihydroxy-2-naphthoate octaprenyltransferase